MKDSPEETNDYKNRLESHRVVFNQKCFGTDFQKGSPAYIPKGKSKVISSERIDLIIDALRNHKKHEK